MAVRRAFVVLDQYFWKMVCLIKDLNLEFLTHQVMLLGGRLELVSKDTNSRVSFSPPEIWELIP